MQPHLKKIGPSVATLSGGTAHVLLAPAGAPQVSARTRAAAVAVDWMTCGLGLPELASAFSSACPADLTRAEAASFAGASAGAGAGAAAASGGKHSTLVSVMGSVNTRQPVSGRPAAQMISAKHLRLWA